MAYPVASLCLGLVLAFVAALWLANLIARLGFPLPSSERRIGQIDGLRGFLSLSVMAHHFVIWTQITRLGGDWTPPTIYFFQQLGSAAVALFFMTTGLLFYPRILAGFKGNDWLAVLIGRAFRLIPMSAAAFALVTLVVMARTGRGLDADFPASALQWIIAYDTPPLLGFAESARVNAGVLWSLYFEWQFYLFALPLCALVMEFFRLRLPSWALPVALILLGALCRKVFPGVGFWKYLPLFATGMLAYEAQRRPEIARRLQSRAASWAALAALAVAMIAFKSPLDLAWPFLALFFFAVACGNELGGLLRSRAALVLGECSYGIYLTHGIVLFVLFTLGAGLTGLFPTPLLPLLAPFAALAVVALTAATFVLVETPGMRAGRALIGRWRAFSGRAPQDARSASSRS